MPLAVGCNALTMQKTPPIHCLLLQFYRTAAVGYHALLLLVLYMLNFLQYCLSKGLRSWGHEKIDHTNLKAGQQAAMNEIIKIYCAKKAVLLLFLRITISL